MPNEYRLVPSSRCLDEGHIRTLDRTVRDTYQIRQIREDQCSNVVEVTTKDVGCWYWGLIQSIQADRLIVRASRLTSNSFPLTFPPFHRTHHYLARRMEGNRLHRIRMMMKIMHLFTGLIE